MAWPANQTQPHLAASVSLAQASSANATVGEMLEVNKVLRFAKESSTIPLKIRGHGRLQELGLELTRMPRGLLALMDLYKEDG